MSSVKSSTHFKGTTKSNNKDEEIEEVPEEIGEDNFAPARGYQNLSKSHKEWVIKKLVLSFSSMIEAIPKQNAVADHRGRYKEEDLEYVRLLDASRHVIRAKDLLLKFENFDTREFTLFLNRQKFINTTLRPLLGLSGEEDTSLSMKIITLLLVLMRKLSDKTIKNLLGHSSLSSISMSKLRKILSERRKLKKMKKLEVNLKNDTNEEKNNKNEHDLTVEQNDEEDEEDEDDKKLKKSENIEVDMDIGYHDYEEILKSNNITESMVNAQEQLHCLLSFKEALCTNSCMDSVTHCLIEFYLKEQTRRMSYPEHHQVSLLDTNNFVEDSKLNIAILISFIRRILMITPNIELLSSSSGDPNLKNIITNTRIGSNRSKSSGSPNISTSDLFDTNELIFYQKIHEKYIIYLRKILLNIIPNIVSDCSNSYHDDWFIDILQIISLIFQNFEINELFSVWKLKSLLNNSCELLDEDAYLDPNYEELLGNTKEKTSSSQTPSTSTSPQPSKPQNKLLANREVALPSKFTDQFKKSSLGHGLLSQKLSMERSQRNLKVSQSQRFYQHSATYKVNLSLMPNSPDTGNDASTPAEETSNQIIIKDAFSRPGDSLPQAKAKRNRSNIMFATTSLLSNNISSISSSEDSSVKTKINNSNEHMQATVIAASLCELLSQPACLKTFIQRVHEDFRRDELRIASQHEHHYLIILTTLLGYNRCKIEQRYKNYVNEAIRRNKHILNPLSVGVLPRLEPWKPNFINIISTLDRLSFTRVIFTLERLCDRGFNSANITTSSSLVNHHEALLPLTLYTEMIISLRLMLESHVRGHNEIALGALYRLFYKSSTGRISSSSAEAPALDPLPKLLSNWKPAKYPAQFIHQLVELIHQTLRTLDVATEKFHPKDDTVEINKTGVKVHPIHGETAVETHNREIYLNYTEDSKKIRFKSKDINNTELDLEVDDETPDDSEVSQYKAACLRFNVDEYFKRLCSNHAVRLYVRLLQTIDDNGDLVNDRIFHIFKRMSRIKLNDESDLYSYYNAPNMTPNSSRECADLTHLLFNIYNFGILSSVLNDSSTAKLHFLYKSANSSLNNKPKPNINININKSQVLSQYHQSRLLTNNPINQPKNNESSTFAVPTSTGKFSPLIEIIQKIVIKAQLLAQRNPLFFVEILFTHSRPLDHIVQVATNYHAYQSYLYSLQSEAERSSKNDSSSSVVTSMITNNNSDDENTANHFNSDDDDDQTAPVTKRTSDSDDEAEIDFDNIPKPANLLKMKKITRKRKSTANTSDSEDEYSSNKNKKTKTDSTKKQTSLLDEIFSDDSDNEINNTIPQSSNNNNSDLIDTEEFTEPLTEPSTYPSTEPMKKSSKLNKKSSLLKKFNLGDSDDDDDFLNNNINSNNETQTQRMKDLFEDDDF